jgi:two-component system, OmpR family, sensor histidine kinase CpxA
VVRNAIFYSGEGGRIEVTVTGTENRRGASVIVQDNGPGVPADKMQLIFEPFYRVDDSRGATTGGMGLGLAIANNAVVSHGGGIIARNVEPHGLELTLMIPARPHPPEPGTSYGPFVSQTVGKPG